MLVGDIIRQNAVKFPDKTALVFRNTRLSYLELNSRINRMANALLGIGRERGDRIAVLADNCPQYVELYFATAKAGMIMVPINTSLGSDGLSYTINDSGANTLIFSEKYLETVNSMRFGLKTVNNYIVIGEASGLESYEELASRYPPDEPEVTIDEDDLVWLGYTGGTTGLPKGVMLSHKNVVSNGMNTTLSLTINRNDISLSVLPIFYLASIFLMEWHFCVGATNILLERIEPELVLEAIEKERVTVIYCTSPAIADVVSHPDVNKYDVSSVRMMACGGAAIPEGLERMVINIFGDTLIPCYGLAEVTGLVTAPPFLEGPWEKIKRSGSCGKELVNVELKLVNEEGKAVVPREPGELLIRGDNIMKCYWNKPEATAEALEGGWFHTSDLATKDEEGYYYITGRKKDIFTSAGKPVYSVEIENVISLHPSVSEVAVIGVPDVGLGEAVKAVVVLKAGEEATEQEIIEWCLNRLEDYKVPKSVDIVSSLPKSSVGKVLKTALKDRYSKG